MKKRIVTQKALSIIEVLIAVSLISAILTALSVNMIYTQRSIKDSQIRAKATDQAESCLNKFRNLRDSNSWSVFCEKLEGSYNGLDDVKRVTYTPAEGGELLVCAGSANEETGADYQATYTVKFSGGSDFTNARVCNNDKARVSVILNYVNFAGQEKQIELAQDFQRANYEAIYKHR